jgi:hypothetical protein
MFREKNLKPTAVSTRITIGGEIIREETETKLEGLHYLISKLTIMLSHEDSVTV